MSFDYRKLRGRIVEKFGTQIMFAQAMNWSERTLSLKMNSKRPWKQPEIMKALELLELSDENITSYFFNKEVQIIEQQERRSK